MQFAKNSPSRANRSLQSQNSRLQNTDRPKFPTRRGRSLLRSIAFESLETRTLMSAFTITTTADSGGGSLRQAILNANTSGGSTTLTFNIPGGGVQTISPLSPLPALAVPATVDATTMPGYTGTPLLELSGQSAGPGAIGLELDGAGSKVTGLTIDNFDAVGLLVGPGATGSIASNNFIGTDPSGSFPAPNGNGIVVEGATSTISNNVISGNNNDGLLVMANGVSVKSNLIGTDFTGTMAVPNLWGVIAQSASSVTIGGSPSDRNVISGNMSEGVTLDTTPNSLVSNNYIGSDITGAIGLMNNGDGVDLLSSDFSVVTDNLITDSGGDGVFLLNTNSATVSSNFIGTDFTGTQSYDSLGNPLGNRGNGVSISDDSFRDTIGGSSLADANVISNNFGNGIAIASSDNAVLSAVITHNIIGSDITATQGLSNVGNGIKDEAAGSIVTGNILSGNEANGIAADGVNTLIQNNTIGLDINGNALPNFTDGIFITGSNISVTNNTIAGNIGNGVTVDGGTGNSIRQNSIYNNSTLGIDLNADGVTPNHSPVANTGPNNFQNFPVLGSITRYASGVAVSGTLDAAANSTFTLEFFTSHQADPSGYGQGEHYAGSTTVTTDGSGHVAFTAFLTNLVAGQPAISATATDSSGNTSEFSLSSTIPDTLSHLSTTTTLATSVNPALVGQSVTFTANVMGSLSAAGNPTGSVMFMDGSTTLGSSTLDTNGNASFSSSSLAPGDNTITAVYPGDLTFTASTSAPLTETITAVGTTTTLSSSLNPATFGASVTFTASVSSLASSPMMTGSVTFMDGSTTLGCGTLDANGDATFTTSALAVGGHSITAIYSGDADYNTSTSQPFSESITAITTSTTLSSSNNPSLIGAPVTFIAAVASTNSSLIPTGSVTFIDGSTTLTLGCGTLDANGSATFTTSTLFIGSHTLTAVYTGVTDFSASTSPSLTQNVTQISTSTTLASSLNPSTYGSSVTFTANVAANASTMNMLMGSVMFKDGSTVLDSINVDSNGNASFSISLLEVGDHTITAFYSGDADFIASTSAALTQTVNAVATSTTLVSSEDPSTVGDSVTFTATVAGVSGSGVPAGSVNFMDGSTLLGTTAVTGGQATLSLATLAVGSHIITANYIGDPHFTSSVSLPLAQTVDAIATTTTLNSSADPSILGNNVVFTAAVTGVSGSNIPTGTVTFLDGNTTLGTGTLSNGTATFATTNLTLGGHTITASYAGDGDFLSSLSSPLIQNVCPVSILSVNTTTTLASSPNPATFGSSVTFTAAVAPVSSSTNPMTGNVTFMDGTSVLGPGMLDSTGHATFTTTDLAVGGHNITAVYSGDSNFNGSTSAALSESITAITTSTSISSSNNPSLVGAPVTFTAAVTSTNSSMIPMGTVTFMDHSTTLGSAALDANGDASLTSSTLSIGGHTITAVFSGTTDFTASTSPNLTQTVTAISTSTTVSSSLNPSVYGASVTFTASVAANASTANVLTGCVTFMDGSTTLGTGAVNSSGVATFTTVALSVGPHSITAVYAGDSNFTGSTSPALSQSISAISTATTLSSSNNPSLVGAPVTFTAVVSSTNSSATPTGCVIFKDGSTVLATVALDSTGHASLTSSTLSIGAHSITATYSGVTTFNASMSPMLTQTVTAIGSSTTISSSLNPSTYGASVTFTANVAATASTMNVLTGTVTFMDGSTMLGTSAVTGGQASLSLSSLAVGSHIITGRYSGDTNFFASTSVALTESVNAIGTTTTVVSSANPSLSGAAVTFTATVAHAGSSLIPTGSVTFKDGSTTLGTGTLNSSGVATLTTSTLSIGSHSITVTYPGSTNFAASTSAPLAQTVNACIVATTTSLCSSADPSVSGCAVTFTATVSHGASTLGTLTGTVTFKDGSTTLGTGTVNSSGVATFTTSTLAIGAHTITAVYGGDSHYTTSTSSPLTQTVTASTASVTGHVYNDVTGNGLSSDDTALAGITVEVFKDKNSNGVLDSNDGSAVATAVTAADGSYSFTGLAAGRYFVEEVTPTGYVLTAPALGTYYTFNAAAGASQTDNFDNYHTCTCSSDVTKITYTINGCKTVSDLRGQVQQGDTVTVHFTVLTGHTVTLSLVSYTAPGSTFDAADASEQQISQLATGTYGPGTYTMTVVVPKCYFQVDFVCGYAINQFGPANSNVFYSAQDRLFSADNGGTNAPPNC